MRVYFEKPRTTVGWKGLINDPYLDEQLPHQRGPAHRAPVAASRSTAGPAGGQRVPRPDLAAVHRRPDQLGRDRRAHDREPGAPRARRRGCRCRSASRTAPTATSRSRPTRSRPRRGRTISCRCTRRAGRDRRDARQPRLPRDPARRQGAQLRRRARRGGVPRARSRQAAGRADGRLLSHANSSKQYQRQLEVARDIARAGRGRQPAHLRRHDREPPRRRRAEVQRRQGRPGRLTFGQSITDACLGWDDSVELLGVLGDAVQARRRAPA